MTTQTLPLIPDSAPFDPEQRAWLNGFFAGLMGATGPAANDDAAPRAAAAPSAPADPIGDDVPWHDPALDLDARLDLAKDRPFEAQLMAAMGQLDCGQCGYDCKAYALALAGGTEGDQTLCQPGGAATKRKLKDLLAAAPTPRAAANANAGPAGEAAPIGTRANPALAQFAAAHPLNGPGSAKDVRHVIIRLPAGVTYEVGDSLGVQARNCPELVAALANALDLALDDPLALALYQSDIARPSDEAAALLGIADPGDDDLLGLLAKATVPPPPARTLIQALGKLQPRLYSIASSPKAHPGEVHLCVSAVRWDVGGRTRKGVASTFLAERVRAGAELPVYVQAAHGFRLPADPATPVIMCGPGTGIAPFRAFLEERAATGAPGRNWLFFGDQKRACDYLFGDELEAWRTSGLLTRLDLAFSRDGAEKIYVQTRMWEARAELWAWLQDGACFYICGDATRMAKDVDDTLKNIAVDQGGLSAQDAAAYVAGLAKAGRYLRDVY